MTRDDAIHAFLTGHGYGNADIGPLAEDASFRRYLRVVRGGETVVLMDAPPPEDVRPFLRIAEHLAELGLSVPTILAADAEAGLVLEEDLGDSLLAVMLDRGDDAVPLFGPAIDALIAMQRGEPPPGLPEWGAEQMTATALGTLFDWWWPATFGGPAPTAARDDVEAALRAMLVPVATGPVGFVHRDFFAGNLLWLPERDGRRRVGVIDFQGAALGHPAYDLASLLQDARRVIPANVEEAMLQYYIERRPELDGDRFRAAYFACAAQRHLRVACQWVRLALRDGKPGYLAFGSRTWALLKVALAHPAVAPLAAALDRWIPAERRGNPPGLAA